MSIENETVIQTILFFIVNLRSVLIRQKSLHCRTLCKQQRCHHGRSNVNNILSTNSFILYDLKEKSNKGFV